MKIMLDAIMLSVLIELGAKVWFLKNWERVGLDIIGEGLADHVTTGVEVNFAY